MTEPAPAAAPHAAVAEPPPPPPSTLWGDALRRLAKNRLAVAGAAWVALVSALAALAPWVVPHDPQHQEWWIGKRPPFARHATLENDMTFELGKPVPAPFPAVGEHRVRLTIEESRRRGLRIQIGTSGLVERIEVDPDMDTGEPGATVDSFRVGAGERVVLGERGLQRAIDGVAVVASLGAPPPAGLDPGGTGERAIVGEWRKGERTRTFVASLASGKVAAVELDGKAERELVVAAEDVREAYVDERAFEHVHVLGTDDAGRDILSRVIFGARISLLVGIVATAVSLVIGVSYGAISGYAGGKVDEVLMRLVDILYAIPFMFFVIILLVLLGRSLFLLFAAIGAVEWLTMARIVRGQVLSLKEKEFVEAARVAGTPGFAIVFRHLVPNSLGAVIVYTTLTIPEVILTEAFLSFLGLSVQYQGQALESWGSLTKSGMDLALGGFPWLLLAAATVLSVTLFALNFLGDGLRDALDPRGRGR